ncbi:MAG: FKBP-type peptidyl-prolyl cis-trans isomerase [Bacteroidota bacterium]
MIKRILPIALLSAVLINNTGCKSGGGGFKKVKGIEYKTVKDVPGKNAANGDIVEFHIRAKVDTMELADTWKNGGKPVPSRVEDIKTSGQFQAVFPYVSAGDSLEIEISCDTLMKEMPVQNQQQLPWLKKGKKIKINMSIVSIKSMEEYKKDMEKQQEDMKREMDQKSAQQMPVDDKMLQDYFASKNIKAQKTASGLYYTIEKQGSGPQIAAGQTASVMYTGKTLDGKTFDSNRDPAFKHTDPLTVQVGSRGVIPGMDEGLTLLKKGSKATLYIPSPLAYGPQSPSPDVAPNSILVFEVEITDVKAGQAPPQGGPQAQ